MIRKNKKGFTLVELLLAITFFSFLLLFVTFGFVQVNRIFTKGVTVKTIQETSRNIVEDISRSLREGNYSGYSYFGDGNGSTVNRICLENTRYGWNMHDTATSGTSIYNPTTETMTDGTLLTMYRAPNTGGNCDSSFDPSESEELLDSRAVIQHLSVTDIAPQTYQISLIVSTRNAVEDDLTEFGANAQCKVQAGDQFCDVSFFETVVTSRN